MFLTGHVKYPLTNGNPAHNLCGQGSSIVSFTNLNFRLGISKNGSAITNLVNTGDLSTLNLGGLTYGTTTYGNIDIVFNSFYYFAPTGTWSTNIQFFKTGTSQVITHEKITAHIDISISGYSSWSNAIEIYNYDIGNDTFLGLSGNKDFDIYLIPTSDYDSNNRQQNAFSSFLILERPFSNKVWLYNMVGTQGTITYYNTDTNTIIYGTGNVVSLCSSEDLNITQKIALTTGDTCTKDLVYLKSTWLPLMTMTNNCTDDCDSGCVINEQNQGGVIIDYTNVTQFKVDNIISFLTEYLFDNIFFTQYDSAGNIQTSANTLINVTAVNWNSSPSTYLVPHLFNYTMTTFGDNVIEIKVVYGTETTGLVVDEVVISCYDTLVIKSCNWWTINKSGTCGKFTLNNLSTTNITITLSSLADDKTYTFISTSTLGTLSSTDIVFSTDGVFLIQVSNGNVIQYYTVANFCAFEACWLKYLDKVICCRPTDKCEADEQYDFFAFMINAHSFFMSLNDEFNFNYIYTSLGDLNNRLDTLFTISSFIKRFNDYCSTCLDNCTLCKAPASVCGCKK